MGQISRSCESYIAFALFVLSLAVTRNRWWGCRAVFWQFKGGYMYNNEVIKFLLTLLVIKCVQRDNVQKSRTYKLIIKGSNYNQKWPKRRGGQSCNLSELTHFSRCHLTWVEHYRCRNSHAPFLFLLAAKLLVPVVSSPVLESCDWLSHTISHIFSEFSARVPTWDRWKIMYVYI